MKTYVVDAGTKPSTCRGKNCMATIYWTDTAEAPAGQTALDCAP